MRLISSTKYVISVKPTLPSRHLPDIYSMSTLETLEQEMKLVLVFLLLNLNMWMPTGARHGGTILYSWKEMRSKGETYPANKYMSNISQQQKHYI